MGDDIGDSMQVAILLASLADLQEYAPITASIHLMKEKEASWSYVSMTFMKKQERLQNKVDNGSSYIEEKGTLDAMINKDKTTNNDYNKRTNIKCSNFNKKGHIAKYCKVKNDKPNYNKRWLATIVSTQNHRSEDNIETITNDEIIIDSGSSEDVINNPVLFHTKEGPSKLEIEFANGVKASASEKGNIHVKIGSSLLILSNVYFIPGLELNLIFCARLDDHGILTKIDNSTCRLISRKDKREKMISIKRRMHDGLHVLKLINPEIRENGKVNAIRSGSDQSTKLWHKKLGHTNRECI